MAQLGSIDYPNKLIYLSFDTVANGFNSIEIYKEIRELRRTNENHRKFSPIIEAQGNEPKGGDTFTPRRALLLDGARYVPFNTSHTLRVLTETITDDEFTDPDTFTRTPLSAGVTVNIDPVYDQVEIITVDTGGTFTTTDRQNLTNLSATLQSPEVFSNSALVNVRTQLNTELVLLEALAKGRFILRRDGTATLYDSSNNAVADFTLYNFDGEIADPSVEAVADRRPV